MYTLVFFCIFCNDESSCCLTNSFRSWFLKVPCSRAVMLAVSIRNLLWGLLSIDQVTCLVFCQTPTGAGCQFFEPQLLRAPLPQISGSVNVGYVQTVVWWCCLYQPLCCLTESIKNHQVIPFKAAYLLDQQGCLWCACCRRGKNEAKGGIQWGGGPMGEIYLVMSKWDRKNEK